MKRRDFLKASPAALGLSVLAGGSVGKLMAAEKPAAAAGSANPERVRKAIAEMEAEHPDFLNVAPEEGRFLHLLVKITQARSLLELGTTIGYSTLWLAAALNPTRGHLTTLELRPERTEIAKAFADRAGLSEYITFRNGDAHEIVTTLKGSFDLVFHDAEKSGTLDYFRKIHPRLLAPGGLFVVHNVTTQSASLEAFLALISTHPDFDTVKLSASAEDSFSVSYRQRS